MKAALSFGDLILILYIHWPFHLTARRIGDRNLLSDYYSIKCAFLHLPRLLFRETIRNRAPVLTHFHEPQPIIII